MLSLDKKNLCASSLKGSQCSLSGTTGTLHSCQEPGSSRTEQRISSFLTSLSALPTTLLFLQVNTTLIFSFPFTEHVSFNSGREMRRLSSEPVIQQASLSHLQGQKIQKANLSSLFKRKGVISACLIKPVDKNIYCNSFLSFHFFLWLQEIRMENF